MVDKEMTWQESAQKQIRQHEGVRRDPYLDTEGKITIGVGRCLSTKPLRDAEIEFLFMLDFEDAEEDAQALIGDALFHGLSDARKAVIVNMAFNLGLTGLRKFTKFLAAVKTGRYADAAQEMLASKWAQQVKGRAIDLAQRMEEG